MSSITDKLEQIFNLIGEIGQQDEGAGQIFMESFTIGLNSLQVAMENDGKREVDISEHLAMVSKILGVSLEDVVNHIIESKNPESINTKEADQETLDFITQQADVDDYEQFLKENKVKDNLNALIKQI